VDVRAATSPAVPTIDTYAAAVMPVEEGTQDRPTSDDGAVIRSMDPVDNENLVAVSARLTFVAAPSVANPTELIVDDEVVWTRF
jgi:hypothetical protein